MMRTLLIIGLTLCAGSTLAATERLPDLLDETERSPVILAERAEVDRTEAALNRTRAEHGWRLFGAVGAGRFDEPVAETLERRYSAARATVGVQRPLLGTDEAQRREIIAAEGLHGEARQLYLSAAQSLQKQVAEAYARYWHAQQQQRLGEAMIALETELERSLAQRRRAGVMRADEQARLMSLLDAAFINVEEAELAEHEAERFIHAALDRPVVLGASEAWVDLEASDCRVIEPASSPEVQAVQQRLQTTTERKALTRHQSVQSNVQLAYRATYEDDVNSMGNGLEIVWTVSMPFGMLGRENALRHELESEQSGWEARLKEARARVEQRQAVAERQLSIQQRRLNMRAARLERAEQTMAVALRRSGPDQGRDWQEWLPAKADFYQASVDWLNAALAVWLAQIDCDQLATEAPRSLPTLKRVMERMSVTSRADGDAPGLSGPVRLYLWDSAPVLSGDDSEFWSTVQRSGVSHVWISLDAGQIERYSADPRELTAFIDVARERELESGLLLGEPLWTLPDYRPHLLDIVASLRGVPFQDLHLDIEIDQLEVDAYGRETLIEHWLDTLAAVVERSPWPVSVSAHPRDFGTGERCLSCELAAVGVSELALMIYTTRPESLVSRLGAVLRKEPDLTVTLAQSVERELPAKNSWFHHGWSSLRSGIADVRDQVGRTDLPVALQGYTDLSMLWRYENTL